MAELKKNQINQIMWVMVDRTDFATVESALGTDSDFNSKATRTFFGLNHGGSVAFTSGTISKLATTVRSGIYAQTLKAAECNFDFLTIRITHPSCADQILTFQTVDLDTSDLLSALTVIQSMASDAHSAAAQGNSRALVIVSSVSDVYSQLSDFRSDLQSLLTVTGIALNPSAISDVASSVDVILASRLSDILSAAVQGNSRALVIQSTASDVYSQLSDFRSDLGSFLTTTGVQLNASTMSDLRSAIAAGPAATITASDISDIASAVDAILASRLSDILSAAAQGNSRALVIQSSASDIYSQLSDFRSDLLSLVTTTGVQLNASTMSDLRSAIAAGAGAVITASDISDIASAVDAILGSRLSDILSAAAQGNSRALVVQSLVSDVQSQAIGASAILSDIYSRVSPLTFDGGGRVAATIRAINDDTGGVAALDRSARTMVLGTIGAGSTPTSLVTSSLTPAASAIDQFKGRIVIFDKDTATLALRGQATDITANTAGGTLTCTALTTAPASGDTFVIS